MHIIKPSRPVRIPAWLGRWLMKRIDPSLTERSKITGRASAERTFFSRFFSVEIGIEHRQPEETHERR